MTESNAVVAIYKSHTEAENAVKELQTSGFDMKKLSIVGRDYQTDEHVVGYYNAGDRVKYWGTLGAFWGGIWGLMFESAFLFVPGIPKLAGIPLNRLISLTRAFMRSRLLLLSCEHSDVSCWLAIKDSMRMLCAVRCWPKVACRPFLQGQDGFHRRGTIEASIARGTKSKISLSGSQSTNVSRPGMKSCPSPFLILFSSLPSSIGLNHGELMIMRDAQALGIVSTNFRLTNFPCRSSSSILRSECFGNTLGNQ
jgi:hypothetical protein